MGQLKLSSDWIDCVATTGPLPGRFLSYKGVSSPSSFPPVRPNTALSPSFPGFGENATWRLANLPRLNMLHISWGQYSPTNRSTNPCFTFSAGALLRFSMVLTFGVSIDSTWDRMAHLNLLSKPTKIHGPVALFLWTLQSFGFTPLPGLCFQTPDGAMTLHLLNSPARYVLETAAQVWWDMALSSV